jgi:hypothetical protein
MNSVLKFSFLVDHYIVIINNLERGANVRTKANVSALFSIDSVSSVDLNRLLLSILSNKSLLYIRDGFL